MSKGKDIQELFEQFIHECEFVKKSRQETLRGYKQTFATFTKLSPTVTIDTLTTPLVVVFFKTLQERKRAVGKGKIVSGIKKSTAATYWSKLNSFFNWLYMNGHIKENPLKNVAHPSPTYENKKFLDREKVEKILTAIHTHYDNNLLILKRNLAMFYVLLFCGLRREELLLLQIRDIDMERKTLTVREETSKSQRTRRLPLHSETVSRLKDYLAERKHYTTAYLFVSSTQDKELSYDGMKHLVKKLNTESKVRFHLHQFRHTFAMNFLKQSDNIYKLKELMGHKDIRMTAAYLKNLPTDEMRADIESMSIDSLI